MVKSRKLYISLFYKTFCILCFLFHGRKCLLDYLDQTPVTKTYMTDYAKFPLPQICLTTYQFEYSGISLTKEDFVKYIHGDWRMYNLSEQETFDKITPKLSDLISHVYITKYVESTGAGSKLKFDVNGSTNFEDYGIQIIQKNYYSKLKGYCLEAK